MNQSITLELPLIWSPRKSSVNGADTSPKHCFSEDSEAVAWLLLYLTRGKVMLAFTVVPSLRRRDALSAERQGYSRVATDGIIFPRARYMLMLFHSESFRCRVAQPSRTVSRVVRHPVTLVGLEDSTHPTLNWRAKVAASATQPTRLTGGVAAPTIPA